MGSLGEEECYFYDASNDILSVSDEDQLSLCSSSGFDHPVSKTINYDLWLNSPLSVQERRDKFFSLMREVEQENVVDDSNERLQECSGAVLRHSKGEDHSVSTTSGMISEADSDSSEENCVIVSESREFKNSGSSSFEEQMSSPKRSKNWLSKLRSIACIADNQILDNADFLYKLQKVKVHQNRKRTKELSGFYMGQGIQAHSGSILAMKFSPDGHYLATAGMDKVLRVWTVLEEDRSNEHDIPEIDPSCIYFTVNHSSELKPIIAEKEKISGFRSLRKSSDSACVIFPPKVFRLMDKPLHEFHDHTAEILDITWSSDNHLLSASVDKTVRLWKIGHDHCLAVFWHSNYVTCVQFNPVEETFFISGSIDGKIRMWNISSRQVVDWIDVKDIVTAACFRPDGKVAVIGSMEGCCRFYSISDNQLILDAQICLSGKKKALCKRITGIQFCPEDSSKVVVNCGDSQVRTLQGHEVITKYKGLKSSCNILSASFTSSGRHIIAASEDSNVYVWNHVEKLQISRPRKKTVKSSERFIADASIAIPWSGFKHMKNMANCQSDEDLKLFSPSSFSISQDYYLESFPRGSATWPEEKLPKSSNFATYPSMDTSMFKFLKTSCQNTGTSHAWGMVIVTAGYDGKIKSFHNYGLPVAL